MSEVRVGATSDVLVRAEGVGRSFPMGDGQIVSGEMGIRESGGRDITLPTGLFARWTP